MTRLANNWDKVSLKASSKRIVDRGEVYGFWNHTECGQAQEGFWRRAGIERSGEHASNISRRLWKKNGHPLRKKERAPEATSGTAQSPVFEGAASVEHLVGELVDAFTRDYSEGSKDHALAELLFSVKDLKTPYERRAAAAALESLAGRIDAGVREYPKLVRASETLAHKLWEEPLGVNSKREAAQHNTGVILRLIATELIKAAQ